MLGLVLVVATVFAVGIAVFAVQNPAPVAVSFLVRRADGVGASALVLVAAALGAGLTLLLGTAREVRLRLRLRAQGQDLAAAEARLRGVDAAVAPRPEGVRSAGVPAAS